MYRKAVVSGTFYPDSPSVLKNFVDNFSHKTKIDAKIAIVPHAGYVFSGGTAVKTLKSINHIENNIILLGPNHTGLGEKVSIFPTGSWQTPFGDVEINAEVANLLIDSSDLLKKDTLAHLSEHSLEVILPILKIIKQDINIIPITVSHLTKSECFSVAKRIFEVLSKIDATVVVSTDFNHFEDNDTTFFKDNLAIDEILQINPGGLYDTVFRNSISMCGVFPVTISLYLAKLMGLTSAHLIEHTTSAEKSGDFKRVVGYAGILIG